MTTNFPTSLDTYVDPDGGGTLASGTPASEAHHTMHANAYDAIKALQAKVGINGSAVTTSIDYKVANLVGYAEPSLQGFLSWTYDPVAMTSSAQAQTAGTMSVVKMYAGAPLSVTKGYFMTSQVATTPTGCYGAIYNSAGAQLGAISANASAQLAAAALITLTFSAIAVPAGIFYLGFWQVAATAANVLGSASAASLAIGEFNQNLASAAYRSATANTGLTTVAPATVGAKTGTAKAIWGAVS